MSKKRKSKVVDDFKDQMESFDEFVEEVVEDEEQLEVEVKNPSPIYIGTATTDLIVGLSHLEKGEQVEIFEDKGDQWLTAKGLAPKIYILLKKV